jgi:acetoacetate decarboxylase
MSASWTLRPNRETSIVVGASGFPSLFNMSSTMLTKRRAVDHCRVRSSLCRMR